MSSLFSGKILAYSPHILNTLIIDKLFTNTKPSISLGCEQLVTLRHVLATKIRHRKHFHTAVTPNL